MQIPCNAQKKHIQNVRETYLENQFQNECIINIQYIIISVFVDSDLLR